MDNRHRHPKQTRTKMGMGNTSAEVLLRVCAEIVSGLIAAHESGQSTVSLNTLRSEACKRHGYAGMPRLTDIINAVPDSHRALLVPALKAKPVRGASGIAVVAVMCKPHRCPHIAMTGNVCVTDTAQVDQTPTLSTALSPILGMSPRPCEPSGHATIHSNRAQAA